MRGFSRIPPGYNEPEYAPRGYAPAGYGLGPGDARSFARTIERDDRRYGGYSVRDLLFPDDNPRAGADIQRRGRSRPPRPREPSVYRDEAPPRSQRGVSMYGDPREKLPFHDRGRSRARQSTLVPGDSISNGTYRPHHERQPETRGRSQAPVDDRRCRGRNNYPPSIPAPRSHREPEVRGRSRGRSRDPTDDILRRHIDAYPRTAPPPRPYREPQPRGRSRAPLNDFSRRECDEYPPSLTESHASRSVHPSIPYRGRQASPTESTTHAHGKDPYDLNPTFTYQPAGAPNSSTRSVMHVHGQHPYDFNPTHTYRPEQRRRSMAPNHRSSAPHHQSAAPDHRSSHSRREPDALAGCSSASRRHQSVAPIDHSSTGRRGQMPATGASGYGPPVAGTGYSYGSSVVRTSSYEMEFACMQGRMRRL